MMTVAVICLLLGAALGQRFKVLVLLPAVGLALMAVTAIGMARGDAAWPVAALAVVAILSLQIGYLVGICIRQVVLAARSSRLRGTRPPGSMSWQRSTH